MELPRKSPVDFLRYCAEFASCGEDSKWELLIARQGKILKAMLDNEDLRTEACATLTQLAYAKTPFVWRLDLLGTLGKILSAAHKKRAIESCLQLLLSMSANRSPDPAVGKALLPLAYYVRSAFMKAKPKARAYLIRDMARFWAHVARHLGPASRPGMLLQTDCALCITSASRQQLC
jgi:hypothetical protein